MQDLQLVSVFVLSMLGFDLGSFPSPFLFYFFHLFKHCNVARCGEWGSEKDQLCPWVPQSLLKSPFI